MAYNFQNLDSTAVLIDAEAGVAVLCCEWRLVRDWWTDSEQCNDHLTKDARHSPTLPLNQFLGQTV
jgi:hypothetical protein